MFKGVPNDKVLADGVPFEMGMTIFFGHPISPRSIETSPEKHRLELIQGRFWYLLPIEITEIPKDWREAGKICGAHNIKYAYSTKIKLIQAKVKERIINIKLSADTLCQVFEKHGSPENGLSELAKEIQEKMKKY